MLIFPTFLVVPDGTSTAKKLWLVSILGVKEAAKESSLKSSLSQFSVAEVILATPEVAFSEASPAVFKNVPSPNLIPPTSLISPLTAICGVSTSGI